MQKLSDYRGGSAIFLTKLRARLAEFACPDARERAGLAFPPPTHSQEEPQAFAVYASYFLELH